MNSNKKIGFIGVGKMGGAIINGLVNSGFTLRESILGAETSAEFAEKAAKLLGIKVVTDNIELVKNSDVVVIATKPFAVKEVLEEIKDCLTEDKLVISIAAGVSTKFIEEILGKNIAVVRVMPNTPALVGEAMTAICRGEHVTGEQTEFTENLFSKIGRSMEVTEKLMDAVTGISGSGPAFFYLMIEALADGGVKLGLPKAVAIELAAQTALGAAKMILETGKHPSVLKDEVTTPAGCTAAGLSVMEEMCVRSALMQTVEETARVANGLG